MTSNKNDIYCFETPITIVMCGSSKTGKTTFVVKAIQQADYLFVHEPKRIIWAYGANCFDTKIEEQLRKKWKNKISFIEGFPGDKIERGILFKKEDNGVLVLDDLAYDVINNKTFAKLFTQYSHHHNFSVLFLTQSLYNSESKTNPVVLKNCDILILFRNPRDMLTVSILGQRIFGKSKFNLMTETYKHACAQPYTYMICDFRPQIPFKHMLRTGCLLEDDVFSYEEDDGDEPGRTPKK